MQTDFSNDEWRCGSYYELAIELGPHSDERLLAALRAVLAMPEMEVARTSESEVVDGESIERDFMASGHVYGETTVAGRRVPWGICSVREEPEPDWFDVYFPLTSLPAEWGITEMYTPEPNPNERALDALLLDVAAKVFEAAPFQLGLIGGEVSGYAYASEFDEEPPKPGPGLIYLWRTGGELRTVGKKAR